MAVGSMSFLLPWAASAVSPADANTLTPSGTSLVPDRASKPLVHAPTQLSRRWCPDDASSEIGNVAMRALPPGLMLDVGAYDGVDSLRFAATGHRVYAFEPTPSKKAKILDAFAKSPYAEQLQLFPMCVSNSSGTTAFYVTTQYNPGLEDGDGSLGSQQDQMEPPPWPATRFDVPVTTLDDVVGGVDTVLYAKIDAQGHDWGVLLGAHDLVMSHRLQRLAFEISPGSDTSVHHAYVEAVTWLTSAGYSCYNCQNSSTLPVADLVAELASTPFIMKGADVSAWTDVVCTAPGLD